jgi:hypothetical protein
VNYPETKDFGVVHLRYISVTKKSLAMKKLFIFLLCAATIVACDKEDKWRNGTLAINVRENVTTKADEHLTPAQIVRKAWVIRWSNGRDALYITRGFTDEQRDTVNNKLLMLSTDVISDIGELKDGDGDFINSQDIRIVDSTDVVIAYIPTTVVRKVRSSIIDAYNRNDYDEVYDIFNDAFVAVPISQSEYDALVERGEQ